MLCARQELSITYFAVSEVLTAAAFVAFGLWVLSPCVAPAVARFSPVAALSRMLAAVSACQLLRIACFTTTQLPGPAPHCMPGAPSARLPPAQSAADILLLNAARQVNRGCGDLIFSSHMTFVMTMALTYCRYGSWRAAKALAWLLVALNGVIIIASRKHYTVDVVVALFTVPLVWEALSTRLVDPPRANSSAGQLSSLLLLPR